MIDEDLKDAPTIASISSMKRMLGAVMRERWNAVRRIPSPSPTYMENSCAPDNICKRMPLAPAAALAKEVLLHPVNPDTPDFVALKLDLAIM